MQQPFEWGERFARHWLFPKMMCASPMEPTIPPMPESPKTDSPMPKVLLRTPRSVRRKKGTLVHLVLARVLTAPIVAVAAALVAVSVLEPILVFLVPGQPAVIIGNWKDFKPRRGYSYHVDYRFDRSGFTAHDEVRLEEVEAFDLGQKVTAHAVHIGPIGYAALDRTLDAYARHRGILWFGSAFAAAIGGALFYAAWLLPWRAHWLARNGEAAFGAVVRKSVYQVPRRHLSFSLTYQFKAHGILHAKHIRISPQRYDSTGVKDLVIILFDSNRPSRSIVYDYCDFIACGPAPRKEI
jgi:hypothetical protein